MARREAPNVGGKQNNGERPSADEMKRSSARRRERSSENGKLNDGRGKPSKSARLRDSVSGNESRLRSKPKKAIGGLFSKSRGMPVGMKFVELTAVRYGDVILIG